MRHLIFSAALIAGALALPCAALTAFAQPADEASDRADAAFERAMDNQADHEPPGQEADHADAADHADVADHAAASDAHEMADANGHGASEVQDIGPSLDNEPAARTFAASDAVTAVPVHSGRRVGEAWWEWNSAHDCWDEARPGARKSDAPGVRCSVN